MIYRDILKREKEIIAKLILTGVSADKYDKAVDDATIKIGIAYLKYKGINPKQGNDERRKQRENHGKN